MPGGCDETRQAVQGWRMTEESTAVIALQAAWWLLQKWLTTWILFGFYILFSFSVNICADQKKERRSGDIVQWQNAYLAG